MVKIEIRNNGEIGNAALYRLFLQKKFLFTAFYNSSTKNKNVKVHKGSKIGKFRSCQFIECNELFVTRQPYSPWSR